MNPSLLAQLDKEIAVTAAKLDALKAARMALGIAAGASPQRNGARPRERERAPADHLKEAMLAALSGSKGLTKMQVVKKLKADRYKFSIRPAHVARNLARLKQAGKVKVAQRGLSNVYSLAK